MTQIACTVRPGDRLYQTQRVGPNRFSKVPVDVIRIDGDGRVVVSINGDRPRRWSPEAVAKLKRGK